MEFPSKLLKFHQFRDFHQIDMTCWINDLKLVMELHICGLHGGAARRTAWSARPRGLVARGKAGPLASPWPADLPPVKLRPGPKTPWYEAGRLHNHTTKNTINTSLTFEHSTERTANSQGVQALYQPVGRHHLASLAADLGPLKLRPEPRFLPYVVQPLCPITPPLPDKKLNSSQNQYGAIGLQVKWI